MHYVTNPRRQILSICVTACRRPLHCEHCTSAQHNDEAFYVVLRPYTAPSASYSCSTRLENLSIVIGPDIGDPARPLPTRTRLSCYVKSPRWTDDVGDQLLYLQKVGRR